MGWPLNLSVIWRQAPRFFRVLPATPTSEGTGPLEKSAALYQKDPRATTTAVPRMTKSPDFLAPDACGKGYRRNLPLVAEYISPETPGTKPPLGAVMPAENHAWNPGRARGFVTRYKRDSHFTKSPLG